jgi:kynurenine formamidase
VTWYDLTQPFHEDIPHSASQPDPEFETIRSVEEDGANVQVYTARTHVATHVDAPLHFVPGGATIDELPLDRFAGEGVVLDIERDGPGEIGVDAVEAAAADAGGVREGDIVLLRTGWGGKFEGDGDYQRYPWLAGDVGDWLLDVGVKFLGVDTISPDEPRAMRAEDYHAYPIHRTLLPEEVPIAEHLYLEDVPGRRLELFGFPLKFRGGDGSPIRMAGRDLEG